MRIFARRAVLTGGVVASNVALTVTGETIASVDVGAAAEAGDIEVPLLLPGFVDIHSHGAGRAPEGDISRAWEWPAENARVHLSGGTTSMLATLTFDRTQPQSTVAAAAALGEFMRRAPSDCARIHGVHAEGPIVATLGGLPASHSDMSADDLSSLLRMFADAGAPIRIATISPSLERGNDCARVRALVAADVVPSLGHDKDASWEDCIAAMRAAAPVRCHLTHAFNVAAWSHRSPSLGNLAGLSRLPPGLAYDGLVVPTVEIIADLVHVHPAVVLGLVCARGPVDTAVISDSILLADGGGDCPCACYCGRAIAVGSVPTEAVSATAARTAVYLSGTTTLSGSCVSQIESLRNLVLGVGCELGAAVQMLSETPARIARMDPRVGSIAAGHWADLLAVSDDLQLIRVMRGAATE